MSSTGILILMLVSDAKTSLTNALYDLAIALLLSVCLMMMKWSKDKGQVSYKA